MCVRVRVCMCVCACVRMCSLLQLLSQLTVSHEICYKYYVTLIPHKYAFFTSFQPIKNYMAHARTSEFGVADVKF